MRTSAREGNIFENPKRKRYSFSLLVLVGRSGFTLSRCCTKQSGVAPG
jgi:hypothetical protein